MDLVRGYKQVVDNSAPRRFQASDRWVSSTLHSAANYGGDQRVLKGPLSVSVNAAYKISTPARDSYAVYGWWPADPGYNDHTVFRIQTVSGWVRRVVNQRIHRGRWVGLSTYTLGAGDSYRIQVSSKSPGRGSIIADGVKIVRK
jgi:hypothetical protein